MIRGVTFVWAALIMALAVPFYDRIVLDLSGEIPSLAFESACLVTFGNCFISITSPKCA